MDEAAAKGRTALETVITAAVLGAGLAAHQRADAEAGRLFGLGSRVDRLAAAVSNMVIESLDLDGVLERIDIQALLDRVDWNDLLARVEWNDLLGRVDWNDLLARVNWNDLLGAVDWDQLLATVDVDTLVARVDLDRAVARVDVNALLDRLDVNALLDRLDVDRLLDRVDMNRLLDRTDVNQLLVRLDMNQLLDRVDVDRVVARVDVAGVVAKIDVNGVVAKVDVDAVMERIDVDAVVAKVDVESIVQRAGIPEIIQESTGHLAESALDLVRRQMVGLDVIVMRTALRLLRRDPDAVPQGPALLLAPRETPQGGIERRGRRAGRQHQVTGHYAGPVTRLAGYALDVVVATGGLTLLTAVLSYLLNLAFGYDLEAGIGSGPVWGALFGLWLFLYWWGSTALAGRTPGMGVVGLRVVARDGTPLSSRHAVIRVLMLPVCLVSFGLGFLGLVVDRERRGWHDMAARSTVVYDWGDRAAELPTPLSSWLARRAGPSEPLMTDVVDVDPQARG